MSILNFAAKKRDGQDALKLSALDELSTNLMLADAQLNITYANPAVRNMLREAEADMKKVLANFSVDTLVGTNIDVFHKNPAHQRGMLKNMQKPHSATITVGEHGFDLVVSPLRHGGELAGFLVEWKSAMDRIKANDLSGQLAAIHRSQAVIEFGMDGNVIDANQNFLDAMGYRIEEIRGRPHSMFVAPDYARSADYESFWATLRRGEFKSAEFRRIGKGGKEVWLQASYNPILDLQGKPFKVVKYATDITERKRAVDELSSSLLRLAEGNLDARINSKVHPDFEPVRDALNQTVDQLVDVIGQLRSTSTALKTATSEILSGANDLAERTTKQAASIEETTAAMEQLSVTVHENAKRAENASAMSKTVSATAEQTGDVMEKSNEAMERISASSSKISNIIGMIDDIAFQTNLLALNASVEAARAGDAGKGFAVVAVEVRRLAQSAAQASSEVKLLIEQSATEVTAGGRLVADATQKLVAMVGSVKETAGLIQEISAASQDQAASISEVSTAIRQMDEMTNHNAALVEQTNAAIEQTESQATDLDRIVDRFVLTGGGRVEPQEADTPPARSAAKPGARALQQVLSGAAKSYLSRGNTALKGDDWNEF